MTEYMSTNQSASQTWTTELAERRAGLDDLRGDAAGEIVGEEADRLAEHVAVRLPADEIGEGRRQRLLDEEIVEDGRDRPRHDDDEAPSTGTSGRSRRSTPLGVVVLSRSTIEPT